MESKIYLVSSPALLHYPSHPHNKKKHEKKNVMKKKT
jgi:hypothetical protein